VLSKITNYFVEASNKSTEVDSFFSEEISNEQADSNDRLVQLNMRKAYLELALAKTLKEMKGL